MRIKSLSILLLTCLLAGCSVLGQGTPQPLPTVVLDNGQGGAGQATTQPGASSGAGGGATASGNVVAAQEAKIASMLGGNLQMLNLAEGDTVKAGQVLVKLSGAEKLAAQLEAANLELLTAQQSVKTLNENADPARTDAQLRLAKAKIALEEAQKHRTWRQYRNGSQSSIEAAQANLILANDALKKAEEAYNGVAGRPEDDVIRASSLSNLSVARTARDRALANLNYLLAMPKVNEVNQAEAELQSAQAEVTAAQLAVDKLKDGPDPDALALADQRVKNAQAQVAAVQSSLADLELKAPFDGTVGKLNVHAGDWAAPGQVLLVLADLARLRVETTDLSERSVADVQVGQPVTVFVKALNRGVPGRVIEISPLADTIGGDVVYKTIIDLLELPEGLRPGMSVSVQFGQ
jgi:multidrug efflux pump subunit AcrA (membrane-fusion protein)